MNFKFPLVFSRSSPSSKYRTRAEQASGIATGGGQSTVGGESFQSGEGLRISLSWYGFCRMCNECGVVSGWDFFFFMIDFKWKLGLSYSFKKQLVVHNTTHYDQSHIDSPMLKILHNIRRNIVSLSICMKILILISFKFILEKGWLSTSNVFFFFLMYLTILFNSPVQNWKRHRIDFNKKFGRMKKLRSPAWSTRRRLM